jgi:hypothetical protein
MPYSSEPCLPVKVGSGAATCPTAPDPASLPRWALVFYDTSTGTAVRAVRCGSLLEGLRLSYAQARWTQVFTWFGPPDRNTLRPQELLYCYMCVALLKAEFNLWRVEVVWNWCLPVPFITQGRVVTLCPRARLVVPGWLETYYSAMVFYG